MSLQRTGEPGQPMHRLLPRETGMFGPADEHFAGVSGEQLLTPLLERAGRWQRRCWLTPLGQRHDAQQQGWLQQLP
jgi:hypothetical protein